MGRAPNRAAWKRLATERSHPRAAALDRLGPERIVALMQAEDRRVLAALRRARPAIARAAEMFRETYTSGRNVFLFGAGTSGRLAVLEAAELPPTFGTDPRRVRAVVAGGRGAVFRAREGAEDDLRAGARSAEAVRESDLVIGVSASSVTPFVRGALESARRRGARTILVTCSRRPGLARIADRVVLLEVGPEVLAGSTRLKAGTATKLALNQMTTSALASAGKVFGPWMVDLRTGSAKLKDRAARIVAAAGGVSPRRARALLAKAGNDVKKAIVMGRTGDDAARAGRRLESAGGDLRLALASQTSGGRGEIAPTRKRDARLR
jgi:N-acetylmuramic acid 6-phosphate etherase